MQPSQTLIACSNFVFTKIFDRYTHLRDADVLTTVSLSVYKLYRSIRFDEGERPPLDMILFTNILLTLKVLFER